MPSRVGVVSIQGDFDKHLLALSRIPKVIPVEVRSCEDLKAVERLILPGGESTTVGKLMERFGLGEAIQNRAQEGMPIWGTCMGMILMAKEVKGYSQYRLSILDVEVERNAFGAQVHSFEAEVPIKGLGSPIEAVFIRAPVVTRMGPSVEPLGDYEGKTVAVRQGKLVGTSFHPELTQDLRFHTWFVEL